MQTHRQHNEKDHGNKPANGPSQLRHENGQSNQEGYPQRIENGLVVHSHHYTPEA